MRLLVQSGILFATVVLSASSAVSSQALLPQHPGGRVHLEPLDPEDLTKRFSDDQIAILEKLNRRDVVHLVRLKEILVPDVWTTSELDYSPLPGEWPWATSLAKALIVDQPAQVFGAYEQGRLVRWGPVSTGRQESPTPSGVMNLTWKSKSRRSTDNDAWLLKWYFNFVNSRGVSFHEFDLPGMAASHACVRLLERDAMWVYAWGEQWKLSADGRTVLAPGTTVVVQGEVDFSNPAPWTSVEWWQRPIVLFTAPR